MNTIKVLGVEGHGDTTLLMGNVKKALDNLNLRLQTEMVDDVSLLMKSRITGIPALVVRGQVVSQRDVPTVPDLQLLFRAVFLSKKKPFTMKNILVPTDFSDTAKGAFEYARALARKNNAKIKVLNVHYPNVGAVDAHSADLFTEGLTIKQQKLVKFVREDPATASSGEVVTANDVSTEVLIGFPGEAIVDRSRMKEVDLIVMGTTGETGLLEKVFGSISSHVARKAHCPVLLVPKGAKWRGAKNILYATDYNAADESMIEQITDLIGGSLPDIYLVHINDAPIRYRVSDLNFEHGSVGRIHVANIESSDKAAAIGRYAAENHVDLVVMATAHRPFFEELFHTSLTKRVALHTEVPLLVVHFDD